MMVSVDVNSLFTSVDMDTAKMTLAKLLDGYDKPNGSLEKEDLCESLSLCLTTYFELNGDYYKQVRGTPMGSRISGFIAEVVMQELEQIVLPDINPKIWICYVDDTFVILKRSEFEPTNAISGLLGGTLEAEQAQELFSLLEINADSKALTVDEFCVLCALAERFYYRKNLRSLTEETQQMQRGILEAADFHRLSIRLHGINILPSLSRFLDRLVEAGTGS
ncbi:hypothetical protein T265_09645 [Opisthorchis viverrini]|uniref:Reverse transcriptase domain-containing protein n=1 Tax=Opisthorchis viverrini TaxID=6198 RepID=A0A075A4A9_OPIVI|nr:hypothetical protein T265_09645 [Opisthorchis viverrini]KER22224.1 hypothetical protein T265_09645 [Opisthorchis viverrini]